MSQDAGQSNADGGGAENGFFGSISTSIQNTVSDLLPVWAATKIKQQSRDQLNQTTFNPVSAPARVDDKMGSTTQTSNALARPAISLTPIYMIGGLLIGSLILTMMFKFRSA